MQIRSASEVNTEDQNPYRYKSKEKSTAHTTISNVLRMCDPFAYSLKKVYPCCIGSTTVVSSKYRTTDKDTSVEENSKGKEKKTVANN